MILFSEAQKNKKKRIEIYAKIVKFLFQRDI